MVKNTITFSDRIGDLLVKEKLISNDQLDEAQRMSKDLGVSLGQALVDTSAVAEEDLISFIARELELPHIDVTGYSIESEVLKFIPASLARKHLLIPLFKVEDTLTVAMADPINVFALDEIRLQAGLDVSPVLASAESIRKAIEEYYGSAESIKEAVRAVGTASFDMPSMEHLSKHKLELITNQPPVIRLVNELILHAINQGASDIHIEPRRDIDDLRYRVDGYLHKVSTIPKNMHLAVVSRLKVMADLDITERRVPQDGRISIEMLGRDVDIRMSTFPTIEGEKVVLRVLDKTKSVTDLESIGLSQTLLREVKNLIKTPSGLILSCGPTGSGKTTTLYTMLNAIRSPDKNIVTLEDPVEYNIQDINQGQINPKAGLTFASGLRTILRQDPDIIMVGEMRDVETAELGIRAVLTGHLVLSTLHTLDAGGATARLMDMGVEPFLVASALMSVIAQRLVRRICPNCKTEYRPSEEMIKIMGIEHPEEHKFYHGTGCIQCHHLGYKGRTGVFELMIVKYKIRELIMQKAPVNDIHDAAVSFGMRTLREDGLDKVFAGVTTLEEVMRETMSRE
jgi:type IV pilus assembly protein PilB